MMNLTALATEINSGPLGLGYAAYLPDAPGEVCELINGETLTAHQSRMISWRGLYSSYGLGRALAASVLAKIRAAADQDQAMYDVKMMIYTTEGMDIGDPEALEMIDDLQSSGLFTPQEADALKRLSLRPISRAKQLFGMAVTIDNLREAGVI